MEFDMDELENMKEMWLELNKKISVLETENRNLARRVMNHKFTSARERLINKYIAFIVVEIIMIVYMSLFFIFNPLVNEKYRLITLIYWDLFFIFEVFFDGFLLYQIKSINIFSSAINDVAKRAASNWKLHKIGILIGLPLAFGAIILFALALDANEFTIYGMFIGGIIGGAIGVNQLIKFKNYYKQLQSED